MPGYQIGDEIGRGRLGIVYLAVREADGQPVAVKIVTPRTAVGEREYHAALVAVDRLRPLRHPHIAVLWETGLAQQSVYCVAEYCGGGNLRQWVEQRGPRPVQEVGPLMLQCLTALQYAHAHDVIHRGIHPQNVLLVPSPGGRGEIIAKISDFALAHNLEVAGLAGMMATGEFPVDYHFLPREQVTDFRGCSAASDLWSLAATFYYALSGQFPYDFTGRDPIAVILGDVPQPLRQRNPAVPPPMAEVIDRGLAAEAAQRYRTAAEMKTAWERALADPAGRLR